MITEQIKMMDILYVEDDDCDVEFAQEAIGTLFDTPIDLHVVHDGEEAIKYLNRFGGYAGAPAPDLILLDLNLPKVNGKQVLRAVKSSPQFRKIPVVVLTTSSVQEDVDEVYDLGASGFITKPVDFERYKRLFRTLFEYWALQARLPSKKTTD